MSAPQSSHVLVVGGTGRTGRYVAEFLQKRGATVRVLARNRERAHAYFGEDTDVVVADAVHDDLGPAFAGITTVVSTLGSRDVHGGGLRTVDLAATKRLVAAAQAAEVEQFVLCSTIGAVPTAGISAQMLEWFAPKGEAEAALQASGLTYTIVRPGGLFDGWTDDPRMIDCQRVAQALVAALTRPDARGNIYELSNGRLAQPGADATLGLQV